MTSTDSIDVGHNLENGSVHIQDAAPPAHRRSHRLTAEAVERKRLVLALNLERRKQLQSLAIQKFLVYFACITLGLCSGATLVLFTFQGFHTAGFNLDSTLLQWLGGATIGAIAGLTAIVYQSLFKEAR
jgi:hypothetical protein